MIDKQSQISLFDDDLPFSEDFKEDTLDVNDLEDFLGYDDPPLLLVDTDPDRAIARQQEMMAACFGGIGEETKEAKRLGLAMQQLDLEQRHALRLLLVYQDLGELIAHLERCLSDRAYGYGERGDQGRTIAQAMAAVAVEGNLAEVAANWLVAHREFQQHILSGRPFSFRSLFDFGDLDSFVPLVQRVGDNVWQLGREDEGKTRRFEGEPAAIWPRLCDTYVEWSEADNEAWLNDLKRRSAKLPDSILRVARAERLRKECNRIEALSHVIRLQTEPRDGPDWPQLTTLGNQIGLTRLSGHSLYELAWQGGLHLRRFELSSTTRNKLPVEHIELALALAETLATEHELAPEPATAGEVEAAYLRRLKVSEARLDVPLAEPLPEAIAGQPVVTYHAGGFIASVLHHPENFAYVAAPGAESGILLHRNSSRGVMAALPVVKGRVRRGSPLMTTPLADLDLSQGRWLRALCAWGVWLAAVMEGR